MLNESDHELLRLELMQGRRQVPQLGAVVVQGASLPLYAVVDQAGSEVELACRYLRDRGKLTVTSAH
ncbi:hypothetical protein [Streptomyces vinaceus]|uniref:hypothetical protein n=1 Tax=Streptomyces vinaceus TaxID=1960 RepID=UPI00369A197E